MEFVSAAPTSPASGDGLELRRVNRFSGSCVASAYVPLPIDYVQGIDIQKRDFETRHYSYLAGNWAGGGWWYYYLYGLAVKEPLGTWCLVFLALSMTIVNCRFSAFWRDEMMLVAPFLMIFIFVSSQTGFSTHLRYISRVAVSVCLDEQGRPHFRDAPIQKRRLTMAATVAIALTWSVGSSLAVYPHSLSYFNELAAVLPTPADGSYPQPIKQSDEHRGVWSRIKYALTAGPRNGPRHLLDSNIDWGQDLFYLKDWLDAHPDVRLNGWPFGDHIQPRWRAFPKRPFRPPTSGCRGPNGQRRVFLTSLARSRAGTP